MAVGLPAKVSYVDGDVFSASDINDTNGTLNLVGQTQNFYAGKNKIINGDFGIWQRGTSYSAGGFGVYGGMDRFRVSSIGASSTVSRQTFTAGTAPVAGYEAEFFARLATGASAMTYWDFGQPIEDVRTFAGQTVTISFWAKSSAATTILIRARQDFGTGGSSAVNNDSTPFALTTSWVRYSATISVPSITGKTIGTGSNLGVYAQYSSGTINGLNIDFWGFQIEAGSTATAFQTATGTIQGELAACQRYFTRYGKDGNFNFYGIGAYFSNVTDIVLPFPVKMRVNPSVTFPAASNFVVNGGACSAVSGGVASTLNYNLAFTASGAAGNGDAVKVYDAGSNNSYIDISAEL
jgi:hypothetical protein